MDAESVSMIGAAAVFGALVLKATDLVKYLNAMRSSDQKTRSDGQNGTITLVLNAVLGVGVVFLMAQTQWADEITIGEETLATLGGGSLTVLGLTISSFGSLLYDLKKAVDGTETASTPAITPAAEERRQEQLAASLTGS